jgi:hypothetical protein
MKVRIVRSYSSASTPRCPATRCSPAIGREYANVASVRAWARGAGLPSNRERHGPTRGREQPVRGQRPTEPSKVAPRDALGYAPSPSVPVLFRFREEIWPLPDTAARLIAQALQERRTEEPETEALSKEVAVAIAIEESLEATEPDPIDLTPGEADLLLKVLVRRELDASDSQLRSFYDALGGWVGRSHR